jgi:creatinine amidohydrolase
MNDFILAEQTHAFIRTIKWDVAVLPFGATEPHNLHMPYCTDVFEANAIGKAACEFAYTRGGKTLLLPAIPFGVNTNLLKIQGAVTISMKPTTLLRILTDVVDSLQRQGIRKLLLLNSHGGNELKPLCRELYHQFNVFICICDWFRMVSDVSKQTLKSPGDHADELETSMGLHLFPDLMKPAQAGSGTARQTRFDAINKGWIGITRPWHLLTKDTGVGDPSAGTADKGKRIMEAATERLGQFLLELAQAPMDDSFPFPNP